MRSKTLHGNASCDQRHASASETRAGAPLYSSAKVFSTALAHLRGHRCLQRRVSAHARAIESRPPYPPSLRQKSPPHRINVTPSVSCCARERAWPCEHPHRPACNLLHTQALQAKVCSTTAAHPQRMLRSNIQGVEITISQLMLQLFSEELRSRASSTKQHWAAVSKQSAKQ